MSILASIVKQCLRDQVEPQQIESAALVLQALHEAPSDRAYQSLVKAQSMGVDLRYVGTLALVANARPMADMLSQKFGIRVEDYLSTGEEGLDCRSKDPLLVSLAYTGKDQLQRRAMEWGANPSATWEVAHQPGDYNRVAAPFTTSWVSQVIRFGDSSLADSLMSAASPPDLEEQRCRMLALLGLRQRIQSQDHNNNLRRFRKILGMLEPGGKHALGVSPWDIDDEGTPLAATIVAALNGTNTAFPANKALEDMLPWIKATAPGDGTGHFAATMACIRANRVPSRLPQWCVEHLAPAQAQQAMEEVLPMLMTQWIASNDFHIRNDTGNSLDATRKPVAHESLAHILAPFLQMMRIATSAPPGPQGFGNPRHLLGNLSQKEFSALGEPGLDAIESLIPTMPSPCAGRSDLDDLRNEIVRRERATAVLQDRGIGIDHSVAAKLEMADATAAIGLLHGAYAMEAKTPVSATAPRPRRI